MINREKVIEALECLANNPFLDCDKCPYNAPTLIPLKQRCDYTRICANALDLLNGHEPRVLEYSEIKKHPLVWLEDNDKEDVIPALFLQYNGWSAEFSRQAPDKYVDTIVRSAEVIADERKYGVTWRAWSARPSSDQMRDTKWEEK